MWVVALSTGMLQGELAGLRWHDVDLDAATLAVTQQRTTADYRVVAGEPKARSRAVISAGDAVVEALRRIDSCWRRPGGDDDPTALTSAR
jgi:integrase